MSRLTTSLTWYNVGMKKTIDFSAGNWDSSLWMNVKSSRWDYVNGFVQAEDHIVNPCPDVSDEELYAHHVTDVYASQVLLEKIRAKARISCTMSFDHLMAPLIVLAPRLGADDKGRPEYREHHEIVLYNEGVNVWHYSFSDGKPHWHLAAFLRVPFAPKAKHLLSVTVERRREVQLTIACDGHVFGYQDEYLTDEFYAGITACEGRNRFYDFTVETDLPPLDFAADGEH